MDDEMKSLCSLNPTSDACRTAVNAAVKYVAMQEAWDVMNGDVSRSSVNLFDQLYNSEGAENWFSLYLNTIDNRADFFGASNQYEQNLGSGAQWFAGAEYVSRAWGLVWEPMESIQLSRSHLALCLRVGMLRKFTSGVQWQAARSLMRAFKILKPSIIMGSIQFSGILPS
ncbi:hypothetical protein [Pseudomonas lopnurensis]|uniref:hypothetical protein n=1 Tax=Pseudomonas lopnurensis TaxID=1477517 RepID=UPI0028B1F716|nr:hypothetical protein [Pseudomonas lopnurensis]